MSVSRYPQITEELLSAYLDNSVSEEDRRLIEHAISVEPQLAWQLESLRQTVQLLHSLPAVALPRAFTLDRVMLEQKLAAEQAQNARRRVVQQAPVGVTWWQRWVTIWQNGSPYLRNGAMIALLLVVVLVAGNQLFAPNVVAPARTASAPAVDRSTAAAPAAVAAVFTQSIEAQGATEQSSTTAGTTAPGEVPIPAGAAGKQLVTAAPPLATTTIETMAAQSAGARNSSAPGAAMTTANQTAPGALSEDASMASGPTMASAGARMPGDDTQPLDPNAEEMAVQPNGPTVANQPATQERAAVAIEAEIPTSTPLPAANQPAVTELAQSSDTVVAAGVFTGTTIVDPVATPTMTATATVTPTGTITATATVTTTVTPTVTEISQGPLPPQVQAMQVLGNSVTMLQTLFTQLTATIALTLSLLWWRSQTA